MIDRSPIYESIENKHTQAFKKYQSILNIISTSRLGIVIAFFIVLYYWLTTQNNVYIFILVAFVAIFSILVRRYSTLSYKKRIRKHLININKNERNYILNNVLSYKNGNSFTTPKHAYTYDLDIFGENSLFHHINRTATYIGENTLANLFCSLLSNTDIVANQEAIKELKEKLSWRQHILALAMETADSKASYDSFIHWASKKTALLPRIIIILSYIAPISFLLLLISSLITNNNLLWHITETAFVANIILTFSQYKKIKEELIVCSNIDKIILNYSLILQKIEGGKFENPKLKKLIESLKKSSVYASVHIKKLSSLYAKLESINNLLIAILLNGFMSYHLHIYRKITNWKRNNKDSIPTWLDIIGEFESLNSLANFAYNNPNFTFPVINKELKIEFKDLGHPLIHPNKRISNDIDFIEHSFIILTGSNMSGKSTFLRSLGINMLLSGIGSVVCATKAQVHPMKIWVSMRLSDSLTDNESYFYAEIRRLKEILDSANENICFVLLDEILRGTNSEDKRIGTIEMIKKIISKRIVGAIATHDLEVCNIANDYPDTLTNKCFEVEMQNNELYFDYKLNQGICKSKSASFLMKKIGIIESR